MLEQDPTHIQAIRAAARLYSQDNEFAPCSTFLEEEFGYGPCARYYFVEEMKRAKALVPFAAPFDPRVRQCRCASGCNAAFFMLLGLFF